MNSLQPTDYYWLWYNATWKVAVLFSLLTYLLWPNRLVLIENQLESTSPLLFYLDSYGPLHFFTVCQVMRSWWETWLARSYTVRGEFWTNLIGVVRQNGADRLQHVDWWDVVGVFLEPFVQQKPFVGVTPEPQFLELPSFDFRWERTVPVFLSQQALKFQMLLKNTCKQT